MEIRKEKSKAPGELLELKFRLPLLHLIQKMEQVKFEAAFTLSTDFLRKLQFLKKSTDISNPFENF